jgi:hypothetical protein
LLFVDSNRDRADSLTKQQTTGNSNNDHELRSKDSQTLIEFALVDDPTGCWDPARARSSWTQATKEGSKSARRRRLRGSAREVTVVLDPDRSPFRVGAFPADDRRIADRRPLPWSKRG